MTERLVVVGGDAAGMSAAAGARRRRPVYDLEGVAFAYATDPDGIQVEIWQQP